jgi:arylsulfatase
LDPRGRHLHAADPPLADGIRDKGAIRHAPGYLPDIMATILDVTGTRYPEERDGHAIAPLEGTSLTSVIDQDQAARPAMFWEHEGNAAVRIGRWKLVKKFPGPWELYDMESDRTELTDLADRHPERVADMAEQYGAWAARCGVIPREKILDLMRQQNSPPAFWEREAAVPDAGGHDAGGHAGGHEAAGRGSGSPLPP